MTAFEQRIHRILTSAHVQRNARTWHEYEKAKRVIQELELSSYEYMAAMMIAAAWVGV